MGIKRNVLKICSDTNGELESYLLNFRNTTLVNIGQSPTKLFSKQGLENKITM